MSLGPHDRSTGGLTSDCCCRRRASRSAARLCTGGRRSRIASPLGGDAPRTLLSRNGGAGTTLFLGFPSPPRTRALHRSGVPGSARRASSGSQARTARCRPSVPARRAHRRFSSTARHRATARGTVRTRCCRRLTGVCYCAAHSSAPLRSPCSERGRSAHWCAVETQRVGQHHALVGLANGWSASSGTRGASLWYHI